MLTDLLFLIEGCPQTMCLPTNFLVGTITGYSWFTWPMFYSEILLLGWRVAVDKLL